MLTIIADEKEFRLYELAAAKLATSVHLWSPGVLAITDLLLLLPQSPTADLPLPDTQLLQTAGWQLCHTSIIQFAENGTSSRFLHTHMFSRLRLWQLHEYDAVLSLDIDTIVVGDLSLLFSKHLARMHRRNLTIAAAHDGLQHPCLSKPRFNAGVLLLTPNPRLFSRLTQAMHDQFDHTMAEQSLLNHVYAPHSFVPLPYAYNTQVGNALCASNAMHDARILHFTYPKPWSMRRSVFSCAWNDWHCLDSHMGFAWTDLGAYVHGSTHLCLLWEMLPTSVNTPVP